MESENIKSQRMVRILLFLQEKKGQWVNTGHLLESLGLGEESRRGVERDVVNLDEMGVIESRKDGRDKFYRIPWAAAKVSFADLRQNDFFSFLMLTRWQNVQMQGASVGMDKIAELIAQGARATRGIHSVDLYDEFYRNFAEYVTFMGENAGAGPKAELVPVLFQALVQHRTLEISYQGMQDEEPRERTIEPWHMLAFRNELYFLCPRSEDRTKLFRCKLSRIVKARLGRATFAVDWAVLRPEIRLLENSIGMWSEPGAKVRTIRLAFGWGMRLFLQERNIHPTQKIRECVDTETGEKWIEMTLKTCLSEDLRDWVRR